ncbi:tetraprenyl-beta-curcumene synthase family protein [Thalassobacillus hwangdonensis]|uniref:Tetraprenyl-beta-curcumene synthase family protein n=1 Tax=Thalassobacillus hwangdonensis TaxID=546108 RepID=A0ABW3L475_9BACI
MMGQVYVNIFPKVKKELNGWRERAEAIPDKELRKQALASIDSKTFHCEGGSIYALLAQDQWQDAVRFIVAYQTISDYLDNLCDRSVSLDPVDFRMLHESMTDALSPGNALKDYYHYRDNDGDGGYLRDLVSTCQRVLEKYPDYAFAQTHVKELGFLYNDLQVHKHVVEEERIPRLKNWFAENKHLCPDMGWYEFSACTGSTLGIFCLVSYSLGGTMSKELAEQVGQSYFPFMQGLHILLDYYIDQQEDQIEGDLNFCSYYDDSDQMETRFVHFVQETNRRVSNLPDSAFHQMIHEGLVGMYLADEKVDQLEFGKQFVRKLLKVSGRKAKFFYYNTKMYNKLKPGRSHA